MQKTYLKCVLKTYIMNILTNDCKIKSLDHHYEDIYVDIKNIVKCLMPELSDVEASLSASMIIGECLIYILAKDTIGRSSCFIPARQENIDKTVNFIVEFSIGGLVRIKNKNINSQNKTTKHQ